MSHITKVKDLYEQTIRRISQNEENWKEFLRFAGQLYQLDFLNTCMVYAQRPDAKILAGFDAWLELDLPVRRGVRGLRSSRQSCSGKIRSMYLMYLIPAEAVCVLGVGL